MRTAALGLAGGIAVLLAPQPVLAQKAAGPGAGVTVTPATSSIPQELFQTRIVMKGLAELGYDVRPHMEASYLPLHEKVASGEVTFAAVHWDPLHKAFFEHAGGTGLIWRSDAFIRHCLQGYLVDKATAEAHDIDSVEDLKRPEVAHLFDTDGDGLANLTGCDPAWGCSRVIEHHLREFGLGETVEHDQGDYFAMMNDVLARHRAGEPVLYYTWTPLWVSGVLVPSEDVRWLEVPYTALPDGQAAETALADGRNLGFAVNTQKIIAGRDFIDANPAAAAFFQAAEIPVNDVSAENLLMYRGEDTPGDIDRHADQWIADNRETFDGWLEAARAAFR